MSLKELLEHQYDAVKSDAIHDNDFIMADIKLTSIKHLLEKDLKLLICNANDISQYAIINEETLKYYIENLNSFKPFSPNLCDKIYSELTKKNLNYLQIKLKNGDVVTCDLIWKQGKSNNYSFHMTYTNTQISIYDIESYKF